MIVRHRITSYGISTAAVGTVVLAFLLKPWASRDLITPPHPQTDDHRVDVVFAVDTTGSMGGLIEGAKRTVWAIATHVKDVDPQADLRVGLVAYRDLGDDYVTKDFALTNDMDAVFTELSGYVAKGGGDTPEDVDAGLFDAVHKMDWRDGAKKMIFVVGDAPPASRNDVPKYDVSARDAAARDIKINTIRCGGSPETAEAWQQIAMLGQGVFSTIEQDGGVQQIATPYDQKMAELSGVIDSTTVIYGEKAAHERYEGKMAAAAAAPEATRADRAGYFADGPGKDHRDGDDIVGGAVDVMALDEAKLPAQMRAMSKADLKKDLDLRLHTRTSASVELQELTKMRKQYLKEHSGKDSGGFDKAVEATVDAELK
jgi:hypothetical protein